MSRLPLPLSLSGLEGAARAALDPGAFGYISGGAGDEWTVAENIAAWQRLSILPRVLIGSGKADTAVDVLGTTMPHPIIVAPMAYQRIATPDGEIALTRAAAATSTTMCLSTLSTVSAHDVAIAVPGTRLWFQVYVFTDRELTHQIIESALASGYSALVVTVDFPVSGRRQRDVDSGFVVTQAVPAISATGMDGAFQPHQTQSQIDPRLSWTDIAEMASRYSVPLLVKGILTPDDAVRAVDAGAAGIVVSNHGGRQLDGSAATATVLAGIVDAVAGRGDVMVDGGVRRGSDILRALALGASAVMVGRPLYWGLAVDGATGAQVVLELLLDELANALILSGANSARALHRGFIAPA